MERRKGVGTFEKSRVSRLEELHKKWRDTKLSVAVSYQMLSSPRI